VLRHGLNPPATVRGRYITQFKRKEPVGTVRGRYVRQIQGKQEEARKPVRRGAGTAVPCPYMGGLIVGRLVTTF
jgi:hypothetical protein